MTEKEKMEAGYLYLPSGELVKHRYKIQDAVFEYNKIPPSHLEERTAAIKKILGKTGEKVDILPPFKCDYGYHIEVGENFFANYNFIVLDGNMVRIGDNVLIAPNVSIYAAGQFIIRKLRRKLQCQKLKLVEQQQSASKRQVQEN